MQRITLQQSRIFRTAELADRVANPNFQKFLKMAAISAGTILLLGVLMFGLRGLFLSRPVLTPNPIPVVSSVNASGVVPINIPTNPLTLGFNIANNGSVFVRGARVTDISGDTILTDMSWGSTNFIWSIKTTSATNFLNQQGQKQTIADIKVGDVVMITGKLENNSNQPVIDADVVRN